MLQAYFDDSGSDTKSQHYVLAGFCAPSDIWSRFTKIWDDACKKSPSINYLKMSEAMGLKGEFDGWAYLDRNKKLDQLSEIIANLDLLRVQVFLERQSFDDFVKGTNFQKIFDDPYFICFNHLCMSLAATDQLEWSKECDIVFDEHGKIGKDTIFWWTEARKHMPPKWADRLAKPTFKDEKCIKPLQAADMLAWLIRDSLRRGPNLSQNDAAYTPVKNVSYKAAISKHVSKDDLMQLGASMIVAKDNMIRDFGTDDFVYEESSRRFVRRRNQRRS